MKNCTPLWREAHFEVKSVKNWRSRTTFGSCDVQKVHAVVARKHISKSKVLKTGRLGPLFEVAMSKKCTPLWREAHFEVKSVKNWRSRITFGSCDVQKVHAIVARSTFRSQNVQNTPCSDHFWRLRCRKSARRGGAKHILKSKCTKHTMLGPLLEVEMSKKCTPLWREAHFEVKNVQNTRGSDHFWRFRCRFAGSLHYTTLRYITPHSTILHYITLHYTPQHYNYNYTTRLHSTTLHYIKFHYTTLHYTTLHYTTVH